MPSNLPLPNHDEKYISDLALSEIKQKIKLNGGKISFSKFMHHALYAPVLGYYSGRSKKFGESGDFITAAEETDILGRIIAKQCSVILNEIPDASIIEYGPGSGALAISILKQLLKMDLKPRAYYMVDVSEDLIERQKNRISTELPEICDSVIWISEIPDGFSGIVIGNEVSETNYNVNAAGFTIHSAVHSSGSNNHAVIHTHSNDGVAVAAQEDGLMPISQHAMVIRNDCAYHDYEGIALNLDERERLIHDLGDKHCLILKNHGLLTTGATCGDATLPAPATTFEIAYLIEE